MASSNDAPSSDTDEDVDVNIREKLKNFHVEESKMVEIVKETVDQTELCEHILKLGDTIIFQVNMLHY